MKKFILCIVSECLVFHVFAQKIDSLVYSDVNSAWEKVLMTEEYVSDSSYIKKMYFNNPKGQWDNPVSVDTFFVREGALYSLFFGKKYKNLCKADFQTLEPFEVYSNSQSEESRSLHERYTPIGIKQINGIEIWIYDVDIVNITGVLNELSYRLFYSPGIGIIKQRSYTYYYVLERYKNEPWIKDLW